MLKTIEDGLVLLLVYMPPIILFLYNYWNDKKYKWGKLNKNPNKTIFAFVSIFIIIVYGIISVFTENLLPFIFVLLNLRYLKKEKDRGLEDAAINKNDYDEYGFSLKKFKFFRGIKFSAISYVLTINMSIVSVIILKLLNFKLQQQEIVTIVSKLPLKYFVIMLPTMVIFAPIVEEFLFRWLLFEKILKKRVGLYAGAIISSAIFALVHFNIMAFFAIFTLGMYNCYLIQKKGYWYAVFNHLCFNSVTSIIMLFQKI